MKTHTKVNNACSPRRATTRTFHDRQYIIIARKRHLHIDYNDNIHATSTQNAVGMALPMGCRPSRSGLPAGIIVQ